MDRNQFMLLSFLTELLKADKINANEFAALNMDELCKLSALHGLNTVIFPVVNDCFVDNDSYKKLLQVWRLTTLKSSIFNILFLQQIDILSKSFEEEKLSLIMIKGLAIARFYKNPELRCMSDLDILVMDSEWEKAKEVLVNLGYNQCEDEDYNPLHVCFEKKGTLSVELHRRLIHSGYLGYREDDKWYNHIWRNKKYISYLNQLAIYVMSEEDELIHQVTHFASHFVYIGTRLKHIFEMALIIKSFEDKLDWHYIESTLNDMGFLKFGELLFSVCETFFKVKVPLDIMSIKKAVRIQFMDDLLNRFSFDESKGGFRGWINVVGKYRYVFKHPILQPVAWAVEVHSQFKMNGIKIPLVIKNSIRNIRTINKKLYTIRNFGLKGNKKAGL